MLLKFKVGKEKYEIDVDSVTTGEAVFLNRNYGLTSFRDLTYWDPVTLPGLLALAMRRKHPDMPDDELAQKADCIPVGPIFDEVGKQIDKVMQDAEASMDPPQAADAGGQGKTQKRTGRQPTPSATD